LGRDRGGECVILGSMTKTEPRKGTPEGDIFDGKVFMASAVVIFLLAVVIDAAASGNAGFTVIGALGGAFLFVIGLVKYHAGHVRRP
jgi:hypothetical protein